MSVGVNTQGFHLISRENNVSFRARESERLSLPLSITPSLPPSLPPSLSPLSLPPLSLSQSLLLSLGYDSVEWDASADKSVVLLKKSDRSLHVQIQTKMVGTGHPYRGHLHNLSLSDFNMPQR